MYVIADGLARLLAPIVPVTADELWRHLPGERDGSVHIAEFPDDLASLRDDALVERWTRLDANTIEYAVTVEDPSVWTRPWTVKQELKKQNERDNRIFYEPRCHEGNYGMPALLAGARADELAFKLGKGPDPATICLGGCGGFSGGFADDGDDANPLR